MGRQSQLFVYGSLMRGQSQAHRLGRARFLCEAQTVVGFRLVNLGEYPGLLLGGPGVVRGELFEVDGETLAELDEYEGHPDLFVRSTIPLNGGGTAQTYVLRSERGRSAREIASGDWRVR